MSNKYFFRGKISDEKFRTALRLFCLDTEAKKTAEFTGLNQDTVNNIYNKFRERIALLCESESPFANGDVELDESYSGARRVRRDPRKRDQGQNPCFRNAQTRG
jgi:transposase